MTGVDPVDPGIWCIRRYVPFLSLQYLIGSGGFVGSCHVRALLETRIVPVGSRFGLVSPGLSFGGRPRFFGPLVSFMRSPRVVVL